ncbi:MAG: hypothetical protein B7X99_13635 [Rhizobiales bacterium 17-65-6]|nr:MAG: hypothetical protein B7X99_13635 [Rhizobiales bacterium 17-65-6]
MSTQRAVYAPHPAHGWPAAKWEGLTARLAGGGYGLILRSEGKCLRFFLSDREAALLRETLAEAAQPVTSCQPSRPYGRPQVAGFTHSEVQLVEPRANSSAATCGEAYVPSTSPSHMAENRPLPRSTTRNVPADVRLSHTLNRIWTVLRRIWPRKEHGV